MYHSLFLLMSCLVMFWWPASRWSSQGENWETCFLPQVSIKEVVCCWWIHKVKPQQCENTTVNQIQFSFMLWCIMIAWTSFSNKTSIHTCVHVCSHTLYCLCHIFIDLPLVNLIDVISIHMLQAYMYGFFKNKRIVLYDTLIQQVWIY